MALAAVNMTTTLRRPKHSYETVVAAVVFVSTKKTTFWRHKEERNWQRLSEWDRRVDL
jgi:hypothetical protein